MFEESIEGGISLEIEVIILICGVENIIFTVLSFFTNKHRSLCLKEIGFLYVSTDKLLFVIFHSMENAIELQN